MSVGVPAFDLSDTGSIKRVTPSQRRFAWRVTWPDGHIGLLVVAALAVGAALLSLVNAWHTEVESALRHGAVVFPLLLVAARVEHKIDTWRHAHAAAEAKAVEIRAEFQDQTRQALATLAATYEAIYAMYGAIREDRKTWSRAQAVCHKQFENVGMSVMANAATLRRIERGAERGITEILAKVDAGRVASERLADFEQRLAGVENPIVPAGGLRPDMTDAELRAFMQGVYYRDNPPGGVTDLN